MFKRIVKKPLFWILTSGIALAIIIAVFRFSSPNEQPFVFEPMLKEDLEVTIQDGKQIVNAKKDGYRLILDPDFEVITRKIEPGRILIYKANCRAVIAKKHYFRGTSIPEWFQKDREAEEYFKDYAIKDYHIEKIPHQSLEAYYRFFDTEEFGLEKEILIQGKNDIFSISQSNQMKDCFTIEEIYKGFQFK